MMYVGQLFHAGEDERDAMVARNEGGEAEDLADGVAGMGRIEWRALARRDITGPLAHPIFFPPALGSDISVAIFGLSFA
ncbi:MAG: hypothetical protein IPI81_05390 [Flavobacteriales bacterium]|nr:hypothetical protein [Flavobacteriales bacterium]